MRDWVVLMPIRRFGDGKQRLQQRPDRAALAEAFARDTLEAVAQSPRVRMLLVVTDDPHLVDDLMLPVAVTVRLQEAPGLNNAIATGLRVAEDSWPDFGQAVLLGDLPALRPEDLDRTMALAEEVPLGMVPDARGTGTVLITAQPGVPLLPAFGSGSAARHRALGHHLLPASERLRRDVDTLEDLELVVRLGVGRHTRAVLEELPVRSGGIGIPVRGIGRPASAKAHGLRGPGSRAR